MSVAAQYPDDENLIANCGYFLPPMAVLVFAPFAPVPWPVAKLVYAVINGLAGVEYPQDETIRAHTTVEKLAALKPVFDPEA